MPSNKLEPPNALKFLFEHDSDYRIIACNGVWGGPTPRGDFHLDFFVEKIPTPDHVVHTLTKTGLGPEVDREPPVDTGKERLITRRLQVGVLLSLDHADSIADYIKKTVAEARTLVERAKKESENVSSP